MTNPETTNEKLKSVRAIAEHRMKKALNNYDYMEAEIFEAILTILDFIEEIRGTTNGTN